MRRIIIMGAVLTLALLAACASSNRSVTSSTTVTTTSTTVAPAKTLARIWYLLHDRVVPVYRPVADLGEAVASLLGPPRSDDVGVTVGITTAIPTGTAMRSVSRVGGITSVDLTRQFESGGATLSLSARLAQLVYTATEGDEAGRVRISLDGIDDSHPLGRADVASFKPRVIIEDPKPGALLRTPFRVGGQNTTYENTVAVEVRDSAGNVLLSSFTTGSGPIHDRIGYPVWGPFEASYALASVGTGSGVVAVYETSAEDGKITSWFAVPVRFSHELSGDLPGAGNKPVSIPDTAGGPNSTAALVDVRTGRHVGFERVVFEFSNTLPGYSVRYVELPITADPSDLPIDLLADGALMVRMSAASGVDLSSADARRTYTGPTRVGAGYPAVHEVVQVGDFEGVLQWAISTWTRPPFRVTTLANPPRLVIDIASAAVLPASS